MQDGFSSSGWVWPSSRTPTVPGRSWLIVWGTCRLPIGGCAHFPRWRVNSGADRRLPARRRLSTGNLAALEFTSSELPGRFPTVYAGQRLNHRESGGMADAPDLGSGARKGVGVRLPPLAQSDQAVPAATSTTSMPRPGLLPLSLPLTPETRAAPGHPRGDRHDLLQRGRDLRREPDALKRIVEVEPGRRAPARRVDRPDVDADERALPLGQLPPSPFGARSLRWK
jgi:hypothetical protein